MNRKEFLKSVCSLGAVMYIPSVFGETKLKFNLNDFYDYINREIRSQWYESETAKDAHDFVFNKLESYLKPFKDNGLILYSLEDPCMEDGTPNCQFIHYHIYIGIKDTGSVFNVWFPLMSDESMDSRFSRERATELSRKEGKYDTMFVRNSWVSVSDITNLVKTLNNGKEQTV